MTDLDGFPFAISELIDNGVSGEFAEAIQRVRASLNGPLEMLVPGGSDIQPGDAIMNGWACFPDLEQLKQNFDVVIFLDFCVGIEAAVIHHLLHSYAQGYGEMNPVFASLIDAGHAKQYQGFGLTTPNQHQVLKEIQDRALQSPILKKYNTWQHGRLARPADIPVPDRWEVMKVMTMMMAETVELEAAVTTVYPIHALQALLDTTSFEDEGQAMAFLEVLSQSDHTLKTVAELVNVLLSKEAELLHARTALESFPIPVIAFDALSRITSLEYLPRAVLEIRYEYRLMRERFAEWDAILRSPETSKPDLKKVFGKMRRAIREVLPKDQPDTVRILTAIASGVETVSSVDPESVTALGNLSKYIRLAVHAFNLAEKAKNRFYLRPLLASRDWFMESNLTAMYDLVKRHFGHELTQQELGHAKRFLTARTHKQT